MSIQRAEDLKREWTDRFVKVQGGVPELRRFEGLVGTVKTVNMNCRLLIEFDTPADISWYDIAPQFVLSVDPEEARKVSEASKVIEASSDKTAAKPAAAAKAAAKPAAGGSPLDAIRAGGAASTAAKPASGGSPLDAIRAGGAAGSKSSATPQAQTADTKPTPAATSGGSPLDQIRAQSSGGSAGDSAATDDVTPPKASDTKAVSDANSSGASVATVAGTTATATGAAAATGAVSANATASAIEDESVTGPKSTGEPTANDAVATTNKSEAIIESPSDATKVIAETQPDNSLPTTLLSSPSTDSTATASSDSVGLSALDQVRAQANADSATQSGISAVQQTLFDQVQQQAANDNAGPAVEHASTDQSSAGLTAMDSTVAANSSGTLDPPEDEIQSTETETTAASETSIAGEEDPVKQTFKGRKLPKLDDLKIVEGIGPKIEGLFQADGIKTWKQLSEADSSRLKKILEDAGPRFRMHNPETWPQQAALADRGKWQELEQLQDDLDGGRPAD